MNFQRVSCKKSCELVPWHSIPHRQRFHRVALEANTVYARLLREKLLGCAKRHANNRNLHKVHSVRWLVVGNERSVILIDHHGSDRASFLRTACLLKEGHAATSPDYREATLEHWAVSEVCLRKYWIHPDCTARDFATATTELGHDGEALPPVVVGQPRNTQGDIVWLRLCHGAQILLVKRSFGSMQLYMYMY